MLYTCTAAVPPSAPGVCFAIYTGHLRSWHMITHGVDVQAPSSYSPSLNEILARNLVVLLVHSGMGTTRGKCYLILYQQLASGNHISPVSHDAPPFRCVYGLWGPLMLQRPSKFKGKLAPT